MISVSIVLFHNKYEEIFFLINSILDSVNVNISNIYLIDNSSNSSLKVLKNIDKKVIYFFNNKNLGYGKGHNIGLKLSIKNRNKYHIVINPDVIINKDVIQKITKFMNENPDVGQVMPKVLYPDGKVQYLCKLIPTPFDLFIRIFVPKKIFKSRRNIFQLKFTNYNKIMEVPYLSGCFMFLRTKVLEDIGLFDERFFMYPEDIDLTRRINEKYKTIFFPKTFIYHGHAKESFKKIKLLYVHVINLIIYFNKWGWIFDSKRKKINKTILKQLN